jgi:subtilisin family serine protease
VFFNGTSQATPQVAGTVALMEAYHGGPRSLTPAQVAALLAATADPIPGAGPAREGAGRVDTANAVAAAHP